MSTNYKVSVPEDHEATVSTSIFDSISSSVPGCIFCSYRSCKRPGILLVL